MWSRRRGAFYTDVKSIQPFEYQVVLLPCMYIETRGKIQLLPPEARAGNVIYLEERCTKKAKIVRLARQKANWTSSSSASSSHGSSYHVIGKLAAEIVTNERNALTKLTIYKHLLHKI